MISIRVSSLADDGPGTLRAALRAAETAGQPVLISFAPDLAGGVIRLSSPLAFDAGEATIRGLPLGDGSAGVTVAGGRFARPPFFEPEGGIRHLDVGAAATLRIETLRLTGGTEVTPPESGSDAVGSIVNAGRLTLADVLIEDIVAISGSAQRFGPDPGDAATILNLAGGQMTLAGVLLRFAFSQAGGGAPFPSEGSTGVGGDAVAGVLNEGLLRLGRFGAQGDGRGGFLPDAPDLDGLSAVGVLNRGRVEPLADPGGFTGRIAVAHLDGQFPAGGFGGAIDADGGSGAAGFATAGLGPPVDGVTGGLVLGFFIDERIEGGFGDDTIFGGDGDDFIDGGSGDDMLFGEAGDDTLVGGLETNDVHGGDGDDLLVVVADPGSLFLPAASTRPAASTLFPSDLATGGAGNDRFVIQFVGAHTLDGGDGEDSILLHDGSFGFLVDLAAQRIGAAFSAETISFRSMEIVQGSARDDTLLGGGGADRLFGDEREDLIEGRGGRDLLVGGGGRDTVAGGGGADRIEGGGSLDTLAGGGGRDTLEGGRGADLLAGDSEADMLIGGPGRDTLEGGAGADRFVFDSRSGRERITDFALGEDRLVFVGMEEADVTVRQTVGGALIEGRGCRVLIEGADADDFDAADFLYG